MANALSRRDFLRLRTTERGRTLEVSCRTLFMRCADAAVESADPADYEPWMGEPPASVTRPTESDLLKALEHDLRDAQFLKLLEPEWLGNLPHADRFHAAIDAFRARGGVVEAGT
jgi:hypothetical protein